MVNICSLSYISRYTVERKNLDLIKVEGTIKCKGRLGDDNWSFEKKSKEYPAVFTSCSFGNSNKLISQFTLVNYVRPLYVSFFSMKVKNLYVFVHHFFHSTCSDIPSLVIQFSYKRCRGFSMSEIHL